MLSAFEIHLWIESLEYSSTNLLALESLLSPDERKRAVRFYFDIDRARFIAARGRLRQILATYLSSDPAALVFSYNAHGKPFLDGQELRFNLSHSGTKAVYAIAQGRELGVDIERIQPEFAKERIPEMFFSPGEAAALRSLPSDAQTEAFFRCWTRKEAYVKARAEGLSMALDSFDVSLGPDEPARFLRNGEGWSIYSFRVEPDYLGAIVAEGTGWTVQTILR